MAITFDSFWAQQNTGGGLSVNSSTHSPAAGVTLTVVTLVHSQPVTSVTDNQNQSYRIASINNFDNAASNARYLSMFYLPTPAIASTQMTAYFSASAVANIYAICFKGTANSTPFDASAYTASTPATGGSLSTTLGGSTLFPNEVIVAIGCLDANSPGGAWTPGGTYLNTANSSSIANPANLNEYQIVSSTSNYTANMSQSVTGNTWAILMCTFADTNVVNQTILLGQACL